MSIVGDNIRALRKLRGRDGEELTQSEIAEIAGVSRETVNKWESGAIGNIRDSNIQRLRDHFHLSVDDLRSEANGLAAKLASGGIGSQRVAVSSYDEATVPLRTIGRVHAGDPSDEEECSRRVEVPKSVLDRHPSGYALLVEGDCMDKDVLPGYHVVVDPDIEPANGDIAIVELPDYQAVMRRWYRFQEMVVLEANSHKHYDDIVLRGDDGPVVSKGVVVWSQSANELRQ